MSPRYPLPISASSHSVCSASSFQLTCPSAWILKIDFVTYLKELKTFILYFKNIRMILNDIPCFLHNVKSPVFNTSGVSVLIKVHAYSSPCAYRKVLHSSFASQLILHLSKEHWYWSNTPPDISPFIERYPSGQPDY